MLARIFHDVCSTEGKVYYIVITYVNFLMEMERLKAVALCSPSDSFIKSICCHRQMAKNLPAHFRKIVQECLSHPTPQLFPSIVSIWAQYS